MNIVETWGESYEDPIAHWMSKASCLGMDVDIFFPTREEPTYIAIAVCDECVVRTECFDFSIEGGEQFGVWGGKSESERRETKRRMQLLFSITR